MSLLRMGQTPTYDPVWRSAGCIVRLPEGEIADRLTISLLKLVLGAPAMPKLLAQLLDARQYAEQWIHALDGLTGEARENALTAYAQLGEINATLWQLEDRVRRLDEIQNQRVSAEFSADDRERLNLSRQITRDNDRRARIKSSINSLFNTTGDLKSYASFNEGTNG